MSNTVFWGGAKRRRILLLSYDFTSGHDRTGIRHDQSHRTDEQTDSTVSGAGTGRGSCSGPRSVRRKSPWTRSWAEALTQTLCARGRRSPMTSARFTARYGGVPVGCQGHSKDRTRGCCARRCAVIFASLPEPHRSKSPRAFSRIPKQRRCRNFVVTDANSTNQFGSVGGLKHRTKRSFAIAETSCRQ